MAGYLSNQVKLQLGVQTVKGTGVAASKRLSFIEKRSVKPNYKKEELVSLGTLDKVSKVVPIRLEPSGNIEGVVTPEETFYLIYSMLGAVTPTNNSGKYSWVFTNPNDTDGIGFDYLTLYFVDGIGGGVNYKTVDSVVKSFEFKVTPDKAMRFAAEFVALSLVTASAGSMAAGTPNPVLPKNTKIYIDNAGATPFTTEFVQGGIELNLKYDSGITAEMYIGTSDIEVHAPDAELTLNVRWESVAKAMLDAEIANGTSHKLIGFTSIDAVSGLGCRVWFAGQISALPELPEDASGVISAKYTFKPVIDTVNGGWLHVEFINTSATI